MVLLSRVWATSSAAKSADRRSSTTLSILETSRKGRRRLFGSSLPVPGSPRFIRTAKAFFMASTSRCLPSRPLDAAGTLRSASCFKMETTTAPEEGGGSV